ncbi:MAG: choice-of-anchor C family protein [Actinobacteria bacterium]|nr:choice-of-anchor C family protein [Actinomycetota bacterium]
MNLVQNGSFESPFVAVDSTWSAGQNLGGWFVDAASINLVGSYFQAASGRQSVDLNGDPGPGALHQDIATTVGTTYRLRFALAGHPANNTSFPGCDNGVKQMRVEWGSSAVASLTFNTSGHSLSSMGWQKYEFDVVARTATSRLRFVSETPGYCGAAIDDVSIVGNTPSADLAVTQHDAPDPVPPGEELTYNLNVTNNGPDDATDVMVTDRLPTVEAIVSAAWGSGTCTLPSLPLPASPTVTCLVGDLANGDTVTIQIVVRIPCLAPAKVVGAGSSFPLDFRSTIRGGTLTVTVTTDIGGHVYSADATARIGGVNPDRATALNLIGKQFGAQTLQRIAAQETGGTFRQFNPTSGEPYVSEKCDGGVGVMQVTDPPPTDKEIWDWTANVKAGADHLQNAFRNAQNFKKVVEDGGVPGTEADAEHQRFIALRDDYLSQHPGWTITVPSLTPGDWSCALQQRELDAIRQYNGHHLYKIATISKAGGGEQLQLANINTKAKHADAVWVAKSASRGELPNGEPKYVSLVLQAGVNYVPLCRGSSYSDT